jgi:hypothetical protein
MDSVLVFILFQARRKHFKSGGDFSPLQKLHDKQKKKKKIKKKEREKREIC